MTKKIVKAGLRPVELSQASELTPAVAPAMAPAKKSAPIKSVAKESAPESTSLKPDQLKPAEFKRAGAQTASPKKAPAKKSAPIKSEAKESAPESTSLKPDGLKPAELGLAEAQTASLKKPASKSSTRKLPAAVSSKENLSDELSARSACSEQSNSSLKTSPTQELGPQPAPKPAAVKAAVTNSVSPALTDPSPRRQTDRPGPSGQDLVSSELSAATLPNGKHESIISKPAHLPGEVGEGGFVGIEGYTDPPAQSNQAFGAGPVEWPAQKVYQSPKPSPAPSSDFEAPNDLQAGQVPLKSPLASKAPQSLPSSSGQLAKSSLEPWPLDSSEPHLPLKGAVEAGKENKKRLTASKLPRSEPPRPEPSGDREEDLKIPPHGTEVVIESRNWYLGQNEKLFKVLTITAAVLLISLGLNAYFSIFRPQPKYFAVTRDLRVLEMPPLSEPVVGNQALINWAADAVTGSLSLNFLSWRRTLSESRENFDREGFDSFLEALKSGGHLEKIEQERLSLSCVIAGAPVVTQSGLKNAVMTWKLEMPLALSYESSSGVVASQKLLAEVEVKRTDTVNNPRGVVIRQMILSKSS